MLFFVFFTLLPLSLASTSVVVYPGSVEQIDDGTGTPDAFWESTTNVFPNRPASGSYGTADSYIQTTVIDEELHNAERANTLVNGNTPSTY